MNGARSRWIRSLSVGVGAAGMLLLGLGAAGADSDQVPWWNGEAPSEEAIAAELEEAAELYQLERAEAFLEASEVGEDSEHIFVMQDAIDQGRYDIEQLFLIGDATFEHAFRRRDGYGASPRPRLQRVHAGASGGLDGISCAGCHALGGLNGAGHDTATAFYFGDGERTSSALARNPPAVLGLGYVQQLAREMTADLARQRDALVARARSEGRAATAALVSKGVNFGQLRASADGVVNSDEVSGVDGDLVVKPFGWKGHTASLRRFGERAARVHFGIQSHSLALKHRYDPDPGLLNGSARWFDPDGDGKQRELEDGTLTTLAIYMALLETPLMLPPTDPVLRKRWQNGSQLFDKVGCNDCHRRSLPLSSEEVVERGDSGTRNGVAFHLQQDGEAPRAADQTVMLFSDLRRHDMGPELSDAHGNTDGIAPERWLTRPLWGVAESPPYLHDGRAATIPAAILAHDGEAATQRASFAALSERERQDLHLFLLSLSRQPKLLVTR